MNKIILIGTIFLLSFQIVFGQNKKSEKTIDCSHFVYYTHGIKFSAKPEYPKAAQSVRASGKVSVRVLFDESGNVTEAKAISGHPLLHTSSIKAARETKFYPVKIGGKTVRCSFILNYDYSNETPIQQNKEFQKQNEQIENISKLLPLGVLNSKATTLPMPVYPNGSQLRISGSVIVQVKVDLQKGEVIKAQVVSGHPLLRYSAEKAALKTKFEPILQEFETVYGTGVLVYKIEDFTGKTVENTQPKPIIAKIKGGIINGMAKVLPKPVYSEQMQNSCAYGKVEVDVLNYMPTGEILLAKAVSGDEVLRKSAEEAAMKATFSVPMINGDINVYVKGKLVYNFEPSKKCINVEIVNKKAVSLPKPKVANLNHPKHLRITKEQIVAVQIVIDNSGKVVNARAITGHLMLRPACENSARQTKFHPTNISQPIKISALLIYKFKPDGTIDTDIERDDKSVIGTPINLVEPPPPFCNCRGLGGSVLVQTKINEQGNVIEAKAISGHPFLRFSSEKAALESKFLPTDTKAKILISYNFESNDGGRTAKIKNVEIKQIEIEK